MVDREKVIKGLECCMIPGEGGCDDCPYFGNGQCQELLGENALALLKAQEPKALKLSEIHRGVAVWLEEVDKADAILAIGGSSAGGTKCFITENDISIAPLDAEYNVRWRAWTAEPTDAQREAVPWE